MRKWQTRTLVLSGVCFLSAIFAILALMFDLVESGMLEKLEKPEELELMGIKEGWNGFILLTEYPEGKAFCCVLSWIELVFSSLIMIILLYKFSKADDETIVSFCKIAVILSLVLAAVYMIEGFVLKANFNKDINKDLKNLGYDVKLYLYKTKGYIPFIIEAVLLVAFIFLKNLLAENSGASARTERREENFYSQLANTEKTEKLLKRYMQVLDDTVPLDESGAEKLIGNYRELMNMEFITWEEYKRKKKEVLSRMEE